jgi:uncharacterized protein YceH (UPF0502 family)
MTTVLNESEARVLGSLVEKQLTTPEYYPLTLNSLTAACNQKNNRNPVVSYDEQTVAQAIESLREKNLVYVFYGSTSRVPKYKHVMPEVLHLTPPQVAIVCVLLLRGSQTPGELRGNASRLFEFSGLDEVEQTLNSLISHEPDPLVVRLPRQPGKKEVRFAHLLSGEIDVAATTQAEHSGSEMGRRSSSERIDKLEEQLEHLTNEIQGLKQQFEQFRKQFE